MAPFQLLEWYTKAAAVSPATRWPMILARLQTHPKTAGGCRRIRESDRVAERVDLFQARAGLEERLMRFSAAAASYAKLYELTYRNPQWMKKSAEMWARQGRNREAVAALRQALIEGRPARASAFFEAAGALESWGILTEARALAERGVEMCAPEELAATAYAQ
jgi:tetratricopeptide (TPR) repeat protein